VFTLSMDEAEVTTTVQDHTGRNPSTIDQCQLAVSQRTGSRVDVLILSKSASSSWTASRSVPRRTLRG
jgi:hypothetical protein